MKRKIFLVIIKLSFIINLLGQNESYDAMSLCKALDSKNHFGPRHFSLFHKYYPGKTDNEIAMQLAQNPFLKDYFDPTSTASLPDYLKSSSLLTSLGNLDVTNFADGLAKFLVERSKEELNVAFFQKFKEFLQSYPELKVVFPTTYDFLQNIYSYQYAAMLPALKAAFQKDFNAYSSNIINLRNLKSDACPSANKDCKDRINALNSFLNTDPKGRSIIGALVVADNLVKGNNGALIIENLANDKIFTDYPDENVSNIVWFTNLISTSIRSNEEGRVWITKKEIADLVSNEDAFQLYLGLLYATDQKLTHNKHHIQFNIKGNSVTLENIFKELKEDWDIANNIKTGFIAKFKEIANAASEISDNEQNIISSKKQGNQASILVYADYASSVSNFLKLSLNFLQGNPDIYPGIVSLNTDVDKFISVIDNAVNSCYDIKSQNYGLLVMHTSFILEGIMGQNYKFKDDYLKYGTFMANIVEAKNSDQVKAAIEAAVLPIGSASIKRETFANISLNAYIGPYFGKEFQPTLNKNPWASTIGLTAPLGIAFSWGNHCNGKRDVVPTLKKHKNETEVGGKSWTLFIPLIDVGAIASFRSGDDSSKVASKVTLSNIISPGIYIYYGFGKRPVSIGFGAQLGPQLRDISAKDINLNKNYYIRVGFTITVDIPFFNFYTKN